MPIAPSIRTGVKQPTSDASIAAMSNPRSMLAPMARFVLVLPVAMLTLVGCASSTNHYTHDESGAFVLHCNQSDLRWNACYDKAARLCGEEGYQIVSGPEGGAPAATTNIHEVPVIGERIVVRCNQ